jgi:hypothetical protein
MNSDGSNPSLWHLYPGPSAFELPIQLSWAVGPGWDGYGPLALETESEWMRFGPPIGRDVRVPGVGGLRTAAAQQELRPMLLLIHRLQWIRPIIRED